MKRSIRLIEWSGDHPITEGSMASEKVPGGDGFKEVREQDRFLPTANISRIMKKSLPPNAKIAKDAKDTTQECVSEFISFITSEARCAALGAAPLRCMHGRIPLMHCALALLPPLPVAAHTLPAPFALPVISASRRSARRSTAMTCFGR